MAGGPLYPSYVIPVTADRVFGNVHVGAGSGSKRQLGIGVQASLGADAIVEMGFNAPPTLPTGTPKLVAQALAASVSGDGKINIKWASVAPEEDPSSATLNAEGTTTVTWAAGDSDVLKETKITLDADTIVAGEMIVMQFTYETTGWTLAVVSTWRYFIIWE